MTTKALRHYDRIGLLHPAEVDRVTSYRYYSPTQVERARLIRRLRALELPLIEVRRLLDLAGDRAAFRAALVEHRRRVDARLVRLRGIRHTLDHLLDDSGTATATDAMENWTIMNEPQLNPADDDRELHLRWGKALFNETWRLMEKEDRTPEDDARMIHAVHGSAYHWLHVGGPEHIARSHWQCSRVYCVLRRAEPALYHARFVLNICRQNGIGDWDLAFAYEALARAHAIAGDRDTSAAWLEQARLASEDIADDDDRDLLLADLETIPR